MVVRSRAFSAAPNDSSWRSMRKSRQRLATLFFVNSTRSSQPMSVLWKLRGSQPEGRTVKSRKARPTSRSGPQFVTRIHSV